MNKSKEVLKSKNNPDECSKDKDEEERHHANQGFHHHHWVELIGSPPQPRVAGIVMLRVAQCTGESDDSRDYRHGPKTNVYLLVERLIA